MDCYKTFATVYDTYMDNVPYEIWHKKILKILRDNGIAEGRIVDLGCGTGKITRMLRDDGYNMLGLDISMEMLSLAIMKEDNNRIEYIKQPMEEMELIGEYDAFVSICDSINYITSNDDLLEVFKRVYKYLKTDGIFVFDINSSYKYNEILADNTFAENREEGSFIWENYYDKESRINEYDLTLYIENEEKLFDRFYEIHYQRAYEVDEICELLKEAKLDVIEILDADKLYENFDDVNVGFDSERILFVVRK